MRTISTTALTISLALTMACAPTQATEDPTPDGTPSGDDVAIVSDSPTRGDDTDPPTDDTDGATADTDASGDSADTGSMPSMVSRTLTVDEDGILQLEFTEFADAVVSIERMPEHGEIQGPLYAAEYVPQRNYNGPDAIGATVTDPNGFTTVYEYDIEIAPMPDPTQAYDVFASMSSGTGKTIVLAISDPDDEPFIAEITSGPAHGTLGGEGLLRHYTPDDGFVGSDQFTFSVRQDDDFPPAIATVYITVR